jgi:hypothetical protein
VTRTSGVVSAGVLGVVGCAAAALLTGVGVLAVAALAAVAVMSSMEGCEGPSIDLAGGPVALTRNLDGTVQASLPPCNRGVEVQTIVLSDAFGEVLWWVHRDDGVRPLTSVTLGRAPDGFVEDVPRTRPLVEGGSYEILLSPLDLSVLPVSTTVPEVAQVGAASATFPPEQVHVGRVWFEGRTVTAAELERLPC